MSLSDCEKCWETPCRCGHGYRNWSVDDLNKQIAMLQDVVKIKMELNAKEKPPRDNQVTGGFKTYIKS